MSDHRFELHPSRSHQPDGVLQVSQSADVRKEVTQTAFAEKVDVNRKGLTKPGNSDDFSARSNSIDGLIQCFASVRSRMAATGSSCLALIEASAPSSRDFSQASSRTSTVMILPAQQFRATCRHSNPMLPCPKIATVSPTRMPAVSTAATLSFNDWRQAASLFEMRSSTLTRAISGSNPSSEKQPGKSKPMTGPFRQRELLSDRQSGQPPQGSLARAATRSPALNFETPPPTSTISAQNSCPNNCTGASVSSLFLMRS